MRGAKSDILLGVIPLLCAAFGCNSPDARIGSSTTGDGGQGGVGSTGTGGMATAASAGPGGSGGAGPGSTGPSSTAGTGGGGPSSTAGTGGGGPSSTAGTGGGGGAGGSGGSGGVIGAWVKGDGFSGTTEKSVGVSADSAGNIILAGYFDYSLNFGSGPIVAMTGGYSDIFLAKFAPTGQNLWTKGWGDVEEQHAYSMAANDTRIVVAGYYEGSPSLGSGQLPVADTYGDIFVASYDMSGNGTWSKSFGADAYTEYAYAVALDTAGYVLLTGTFEGSLDIGTPALMSAGSQDIFIAKLDPSGNPLWSKSFGDAGYYQVGYSIASDTLGRIVITGTFDGTVDFGGSPLMAAGSADLFVAAFQANGTHRWSKKFVMNSGGVEYPVVATDPSGNVFVSGYYYGFLDFGLGIVSAKGDYDAFIAKLDPNGNLIWHKSFGTAGTLTGMSQLAVDPSDGSVWMAGFYRGTTNFGGGPLPSAGSCTPPDFCNDAFLVKLDKDGNHLFSRQYGDVYNDYASAVALSPGGSAVLTGSYSINIDFGGGASLANGNYSDIFLVKFQ